MGPIRAPTIRGLIAPCVAMTLVAALACRGNDESLRLTVRLMDLMSQIAASPKSVPKMSVNGRELDVGAHRVRVTPVSEHALRGEDGTFFSAARFEIALDGVGQPQLTVGSVGQGKSRDEATSKAVEDWHAEFGLPLIRSVADTASDLTHDGFQVYTGGISIRGPVPQDLAGGQVITSEETLTAISGASPRVDGKLHAIQIMVAVGPGGQITSGDCKVDAKVMLVDSLRQLRWPEGKYMYKRYYILK
jgi:hypothetical protein